MSQQIGWSINEKLLYQIKLKIRRLTQVMAAGSSTTTTTTTLS